ncbi:MAG: hypothetical protein NC092_04375 [Butyrivibrio sp.]|nr:hypothetical protein [Muribaculum sp.]MCM1551912.1 hypothetical protein [Butyrivibrio sp.]
MKRFLMAIVCALCLSCGIGVISAQAAEIMPLYEETAKVYILLSLKQNKATCTTNVLGKSGTTRITGIVELYDETTGTTVDTWEIDCKKSVYYGSETADVKSKHTYTLTFTGTVYGSDGVGEPISDSVTKKN